MVKQEKDELQEKFYSTRNYNEITKSNNILWQTYNQQTNKSTTIIQL